MWNILSIIILMVEILLLLSFIIGRFQKKKLNETAVFLAVVFVVNLALNLVPYLYNVIELGEEVNHVFALFGCVMSSIHMFIGEGDGESAAAFASVVPLFSYAYLLAVVVSLMATISAAVEAFGNTVRNGIRLAKALKKASCDLVIGNSPNALQYAKTCNAVLLLDDSVGKEAAVELMEDGYTVLRRSFTEELFQDRRFNTATRYNVVCPSDDKALEYIDTFIAYKNAETAKNVYLYVEVEGDTAQTLRREIIEKHGMEAVIDTFSTNELLARTFCEEHPVTQYLPKECIENAAVKQGTEINVFLLGYGKLGRELYRQSVLNNQLVTFDGQYKVLPINYYLCDTNIDATEWNIGGLSEALSQLDTTAYFALPELPFKTTVIDKSPSSREVLTTIKKQVQKENGYTVVIINTDEDCRNMEIGAKLKTMLFGAENYHLFVRSEAAYTEDDATTTYFGKSERVFNHDVIVNDSLSVMAKKLNEVYTAQYAADERNRPDFAAYIQKKAESQWQGFDYFTLYSNLYAAMNLRVKLNLLGLDYVKDGKGENTALIKERHAHTGNYAYSDYANASVRNALIAQEHARWNAYHLLGDYLPLEKSGITVKTADGNTVRFNVKNTAAKTHACLTTYRGLNDLSSYLAEKAGDGHTAADYDYYKYDEMLIASAGELLTSLGYSVTEK